MAISTFIASRLSNGNKVFPSKLIIDNLGVTFQNSNVFNGIEKTIPFSRIASVDIACPLVGFSSIIIITSGNDRIVANGYSQTEVKRIKALILSNI